MATADALARWAYRNLTVGDVVATPKTGATHVGVFVGWDGLVPLVVHNSPRMGKTEMEPLLSFTGQTLDVRTLGFDSPLQRWQVANRALAQVGRRYGLVTNNCEHTVRRSQGLTVKSPQLRFGVLAMGIVTAVVLATRKRRPSDRRR